mgnify:CR=1 FL=1
MCGSKTVDFSFNPHLTAESEFKIRGVTHQFVWSIIYSLYLWGSTISLRVASSWSSTDIIWLFEAVHYHTVSFSEWIAGELDSFWTLFIILHTKQYCISNKKLNYSLHCHLIMSRSEQLMELLACLWNCDMDKQLFFNKEFSTLL